MFPFMSFIVLGLIFRSLIHFNTFLYMGTNCSQFHSFACDLQTDNPNKKWAQGLNRHSSQEHIQIANGYLKRYSTSLFIRKMQMKTTVRYHLIPVRMALINKRSNFKFGGGSGGKGALIHCWWNCKLVRPLWKTAW